MFRRHAIKQHDLSADEAGAFTRAGDALENGPIDWKRVIGPVCEEEEFAAYVAELQAALTAAE